MTPTPKPTAPPAQPIDHAGEALREARRSGVPDSAYAGPGDPASVPSAATDLADARDERARLAARILIDAVLLGVLGDALLRAGGPGLGFAAWSIAVIWALFSLARRRHDAIPREAVWLGIPAVALSLALVWRDSESLAFYNVVALLGTMALLATAISGTRAVRLIDARIRDVVSSAVATAFAAAFGMLPLVISDVSLRDAARSRGGQGAMMLLRGALIAVPLLLVFGGLFASADPVFERLVGDLVRIDPELVASHLIVSGVLTWGVGGALRGALIARAPTWLAARFPSGSLGVVEMSIPLGALAALFVAFVLVQLRYFFGGEALVQATAGLSYADYARRGFFELVAVSVLVLPVLLGADALVRRDDARADRVYRLLAGVLLVSLAVIMYSAVARMRLYQDAYGLTTDRLYATVFMGWLAIVFAWFAATVLRRRPRGFVAGTVMSAWAAIVCLNVLNPTALVIRTNIARAESGKELDLLYAYSLGADAVPALVDHLVSPKRDGSGTAPTSSLPAGPPLGASRVARFAFRDCDAARQLLETWATTPAGDWRRWNVGRAKARAAVARAEPALRAMSCAPRAVGRS